MTELTTSTLSVSFSERGGRIVLVQATKRLGYYGELIVHCYSSMPAEYIASVGTATGAEMRSRYIWGEGVTFSDSRTATLKYPNATGVTFDLTRSVFMRKNTDRLGRVTFSRVYPTIIYDSDNDVIVVDQSVYGVCSVSYTVLYQVVYYIPQFTQTTTGAAGVYGGVFGLGSLFAYNEQAVETLEMELDIKESPDFVEYARVVSKIVLDPQGVWEFPRNWQSTYDNNREKVGDERSDYPPDGTFDGYTDTVDGGNCFVDERVHLIVEVSSSGYLRYNDFNNGGDGYWGWENPYFGNSDYNPLYEIRFGEPPGGSKASNAEDFRHAQVFGSWREVFLEVDKQEVIAKIQNEYPGASAYSRPR
jgi:hypothetical protein